MISEGIGGIRFSKNIAKPITKYAMYGLVSTVFVIKSGKEVIIFRKCKLKFSIYTILIYMDHLLKRLYNQLAPALV